MNLSQHRTDTACNLLHFWLGFISVHPLFVNGFPFSLDNFEWDIPEWEDLDSRYEHCSFVPESNPQSLWVFGGAQQSGNRSCIQNLHLRGKFQQSDGNEQSGHVRVLI